MTKILTPEQAKFSAQESHWGDPAALYDSHEALREQSERRLELLKRAHYTSLKQANVMTMCGTTSSQNWRRQMLSKSDCQAIRERVEAQSPGPWVAEYSDMSDVWWMVISADNYTLAETRESDVANFIAASRTDIPALLDTIEELRHDMAIADEAKRRGMK